MDSKIPWGDSACFHDDPASYPVCDYLPVSTKQVDAEDFNQTLFEEEDELKGL